MKTPRVSVIIPFLNAGQYLRSAAESVLTQTLSNWELILVDDGSTDSSIKIAKELVTQHPRKVSYLEHQGHRNRGTSASRNLGLQGARGKLVAFLDADDVWRPKMLEHHFKILQSHLKAAMSYGPGRWWYSWTGHTQDKNRDYVQDLGVELDAVVNPPVLVKLFLKNEGAVPSSSGVLIRKEILLQVGGWEERFTGMYDDQVVYAKIGLLFPVYATGNCLYDYRQHEKSLDVQSVRSGEYYPARDRFLRWFISYLSRYGRQFEDIRKLAERELWFIRISAAASPIATLKLKVGQKVSQISSQLPGRGIKRRIGLSRWRRLTPISRVFGFDRGLPLDRYYIEQFLRIHTSDIKGRALEVEDDIYTRKFGNNQVTKSDVLHLVEGNLKATIVADLTEADHLSSDNFDCIIFTQTLQYIYDVRTAIWTLHRLLKPGGVLLATFPGISQISRYDMDRWGDYWRFTSLSARKLFEEVFLPENMTIEVYGNVLTAIAFLHGLAVEELKQKELDYRDPDYELLVTVRAVKKDSQNTLPPRRWAGSKIVILLYHRVINLKSDPQLLAVSPENFRRQMVFLKKNYQIISLDSSVNDAQKSIIITVDDGYLDNFLYARPILEELKISATFFITTANIGQDKEFWWDSLERIFLRGGVGRKAYWQNYQRLFELSPEEREKTIRSLLKQAGLKEKARVGYRTMSEKEIKTIVREGRMTIGAHGHSHVRLARLSRVQQRKEIEQSKKILEKITGTKIKHFSYPFGTKGDYDQRTIAMVKEAGFASACANFPGVVTRKTDIYQLPRFLVRNWDEREFKKKIKEFFG